MSAVPQAAAIRCVKCDVVFGCDPVGECWCKEESFRLPMPTDATSCLCPKCLREAAERQP